MIAYEQLLESNACLLFETSPFIRRYREQPKRIWFQDNDRVRRYTPDYELTLDDGRRLLVEIKPQARLDKPEVHVKLHLINVHMEAQGQEFLILTDREIRQQPRLENLKILWRGAPLHSVTDESLRRITRELIATRVQTFGALRSSIGRGIALALFIRGYAACSMDQQITNNTLVSLSLEKEHVWFQIMPRYGF